MQLKTIFHLFLNLIGILIIPFTQVLAATPANSSPLFFSQNARTFEGGYSNLIEKGLANACLSLVELPDSLACNPAVVSLGTKSDLSAEGLISNGYSAIKNTQTLLDGKLNQEVVETLFQRNSEIQIEGNTDVHFRSPYLTGRYVPLSIKGFTVVRNQANPDIEIQALQESGFTFQTGHLIYGNLYGGIQTRFLSRTYINQQFKLVDLGTQDGKDLLQPKKQNLTYIEPGLFMPFESVSWSPKFSLFLANAGIIDHYDSQLNPPPELQGGFSVTPPLRWGRLDLSLDYKRLSLTDQNFTDKIHLGSLYHFGALYLSTGIDHYGSSAGLFYSLEKINTGILYSTTKTSTAEESFYTQTVYVQMGWQI